MPRDWRKKPKYFDAQLIFSWEDFQTSISAFPSQICYFNMEIFHDIAILFGIALSFSKASDPDCKIMVVLSIAVNM